LAKTATTELVTETIVQISGTRPLDIHDVNPADKPNPKSAKR
jgi:hypothetical protein